MERVEYSDEILEKICERLSAGVSLRKICEDEGFPNRTTVMRWENSNAKVAASIARARDKGLDCLAEEIIAISDEQAECRTKAGNIFDPNVARDTLRVHARQWYLSKLAPKRYGDKLNLEHSGTVDIATRLREGRARARGA